MAGKGGVGLGVFEGEVRDGRANGVDRDGEGGS